MKRLPFGILFVCLLIPPVGYILSLDLIEGTLEKREKRVIQGLLIQNQQALLDGRYPVQEEIRRNLSRYFSRDGKRRLGVRTRVLVKTRDQRILYPVPVQEEMAGGGEFAAFPGEEVDKPLQYVDLAAESFRLLNQGFDVVVDLEVLHNGWLSNGVLLGWVLLSGGLLHAVIRRRTQAVERGRLEQENHIASLSAQLDRARSLVHEVEEKEEDYRRRIKSLERERDGLSQDAEGLLEEMDHLEQGAARQRDLREETELEILELREELERLRGRLQKNRKRESEAERLRKRLGVLYKNLEFTDRAVEGMATLPPEVRLKAEEAVQLLNTDSSRVSVKRKVFGKGGKSQVMESVFAYSGRLYFHRLNGRGVRVVAVGTKNTQTKDLAYLESYRNASRAKP
ncbi:MAG: hypothetical protein K9M82_00595 [Deltaproteobacteria bacterium]|nr:hypothetical protein [Deltaproteobacteria bacterium]